MNIVEVEYIESGTFVGSEEAAFLAGIEPGQECVVLKAFDYAELSEKAWKYDDLCK